MEGMHNRGRWYFIVYEFVLVWYKDLFVLMEGVIN